MPKIDDTYILPFGTHKGKTLAEIPDSWFIWMYDNGKLTGQLKQYAEESVPLIQAQVRSKKKGKFN